MACVSFSGGISNDCSNNIGGLTKLYLTDFENISSYTQAGGTVSAITLVGATPSYGFYEFAFNRNSATFTEDLVKSVEAGSALFEQTVTVTIPKRDVAKRNTLSLLTQRDLAVIVKDSNGIYWYPGAQEGMYLAESTSTSGTNKVDGSNYVLTLKGFEKERAYVVNPSIITNLLA
jgi:F0F1-type ATP synthase beta subunit